MKIAFIDPSGWDYTVETPLTSPLGGSQSCLCYLAMALARLGHQVTLVNHVGKPGMYSGVESVHWNKGTNGAFLNGFDAVVMINLTIGTRLRNDVGVRAPCVLWIHHLDDQPAMQQLGDAAERAAWNGFAFVSAWQAERFQATFSLDPAHSAALQNCITPAVAAEKVQKPWFETGAPPVLAYTSTPFRGLDLLINVFPAIRAAIPGTRLRVYSSMAVYRQSPDPYEALYAACRRTEGVNYVGSVGQAQLAHEMAGVAALAYPCTFAETFCIAAADAQAAGANVVSTRLGALPSIHGEFATLVEPDADMGKFARNFTDAAVAILEKQQRDPAAAIIQRERQIRYWRDNFTWDRRAGEWVNWLQTLNG